MDSSVVGELRDRVRQLGAQLHGANAECSELRADRALLLKVLRAIRIPDLHHALTDCGADDDEAARVRAAVMGRALP